MQKALFILIIFFSFNTCTAQTIAKWDGSSGIIKYHCGQLKYVFDQIIIYDLFIGILKDETKIKDHFYKPFIFGYDSSSVIGYIRAENDTIFFREDKKSEEVPFLTFKEKSINFSTSLSNKVPWLFADAIISEDSSYSSLNDKASFVDNRKKFKISYKSSFPSDASYLKSITINKEGILLVEYQTGYGPILNCKCIQ